MKPTEAEERTSGIALDSFRLLLPGERRIALWAVRRVRAVQGDSRQLVAGAYTVLAGVWGTLGALVGCVWVALVMTGDRRPGYTLFVAAMVLLALGVVRQFQARSAMKREVGAGQ